MHVQISCEECGRRYKIAESTVRGKRIYTRCKCGARVVVEDPSRNGVPSSTTGSIHRKERWFVNITTSEPLAMGLDSLVRAFEVGRVDPETLVWRRGMVEWAPLRSVKELSTLLLGESAGAQLPTMPPPGNGLSVPPPTPSELAVGSRAAPLPTGQAFRLQVGKSTQTGLSIVPPEQTPSGVRQPPASLPPSSAGRKLQQLADSLDASGPPTERLAGGPPSSEPLAATPPPADAVPSPAGNQPVRQNPSVSVPINLAEPTTSAQTPISMSSSGTGRTHSAPPASQDAATRRYRLVGSLLAAAAVVALVTLRPATSTPDGPSSSASQSAAASAASSELNLKAQPTENRPPPFVSPVVSPAVSDHESPTEGQTPRPESGAEPTALVHKQDSPETAEWPSKDRPAPPATEQGPKAEVAPVSPRPTGAQSKPVQASPSANPQAAVSKAPASKPAASATPALTSPAARQPLKAQSAAPDRSRPDPEPAQPTAVKQPPLAPEAAPAAASANSKGAAEPKPPTREAASAIPQTSTPAASGVPEPPTEPAPKPYLLETALSQAQQAAEVSAQCSGPTASGKVDITIEPWGTVSQVKHLNQDLVGTPQGLCIMVAYQKVRVPAFDGQAQTLRHAFTIQKH